MLSGGWSAVSWVGVPLLASAWSVLHGGEAASSPAINVLLILGGMALITKGGDLFTDSAVAIARATRVPAAIIGATIVSMATTFPEFMVSLIGATQGKPGFAVGNALGSCCCNIGLIVGSCAILKGWLGRRRGTETTIPVSRVTLSGPGAFMVGSGILVWTFSAFDSGGADTTWSIAKWQAGVLVAMLVAYLAYSLRAALRARFEESLDGDSDDHQERVQLARECAIFAVGAVLVFLGSRLMVSNAEAVAKLLGVPELIIGLTVLAIGTSLPEFTISILAVVKGHGSLGIGNIIGANVLNICWVVATCGLLTPLPIQRQTLVLDGPIVLLLMVSLLAGGWRRERISSTTGVMLICVYVGYLAIMFTLFAQN